MFKLLFQINDNIMLGIVSILFFVCVCTALEITSVAGHKSFSEVERYTRDANQAMLSRAAINKIM